MSIKTKKYGNVANVTVVEFGNGTLSVTNGLNENHKSVLIKQKEFAPIGEVSGSEKNSDEFEPQIAITFLNKESFLVFKEFVDNVEKDFNQL